MKKIYIYLMIICVVIFSIFFFLRHKEQNNYIKKGNIIVNKVYQYKKEFKKLPNTISELTNILEMGEGPYYEKLNDSTFIVFYNIGFDDKFIYNSNKKEWQ